MCHVNVAWDGNPHRPFCSERCRLIDLGQWADETYRVPTVQHEIDNDLIDNLHNIKQDDER